MPHLRINDRDIEYTDEGTGQPIVLVHGSASDYRTWRSQRAEFAKRFRVIAYSRRYHWPNESISAGTEYSMEDHVDDLSVLLRTLDVTPAHLVGHSYGGFLCLLLAMRQPGVVRTLVLAEPPVITLCVSNTARPLELVKLLATRPRTAFAIIKFAAQGVAPAQRAFRRGDVEQGIRIFGDAVFGAGGYDSLPERRKREVLENRANIRAELLGPGFASLEAARVRAVRSPTLLVTGERSVGLFHRLTDRLEELLPGSRRTSIRGARHLMHEDQADAYNAAVLGFIDRHG